MSYSVLDAKSELSAMLHGTTLNQVENITGVFNRAARQVLLDIDPAETMRQAQLASLLYDQVFDYAPPADLKGDKIVDVIVQTTSYPRPIFAQTYNRTFDVNKGYSLINNFTITYNTGVQTLRINYYNPPSSTTINQANVVAGNGTWVASGTASGLTVNSQNGINSGNILTFNQTTGTGILTNSTMSDVDLTDQENQAGIFWLIDIPVGANLTSMSIRWGSSATDYWEATGITTNFQGNAFANGQNQIYTLWANATTVGTPDVTDVNYIRVSFVSSAAITGFGFTLVTAKLGVVTYVPYYSRYMFSTSGGTWQETTTSDSDLINLNTDSYNIMLYQVAFLCVQQALGQDAGYDTNIFLDKYNQAVLRYKKMYKSQVTKPQQPYYTPTFHGYQDWLGSNYMQY